MNDPTQIKLWNDVLDFYDKEFVNQPYRSEEEFIKMLTAKYTIYPTGIDMVHIPRAQIEKLLEEIIMLNAANRELEEMKKEFMDLNL